MLSLRRCALAAPTGTRRHVCGGLAAKLGAKRRAGARKQELGNPIAAAVSPRRPFSSSSSSFALEDDDLDSDDAAPPRSSSDYALLLSEAEQQGDWVRAVELIAEARVLRVKLPAAGYEAAARVAADKGDWQQAATFLARAARGGAPSSSSSSSSSSSGGNNPLNPPACSAIKEVFSRLAREVQAEACMELLDLLRQGEAARSDAAASPSSPSSSSPSSSPSPSPSSPSSSPSPSSSSSPSSSWSQRPAETRSHALNCAARACARATTGGKKMMAATDKDDADGERVQQQLSEEDMAIFFEASLSLLDDMREGNLQIEDGTFGSVALAALAMSKPELSEELMEERDYL